MSVEEMMEGLKAQICGLVARNAELQAMLDTAKALELQLDARIRELTSERGAARAQPVPIDVCGTPNKCGSHCHLAPHHPPPCLCVGDVDGAPGTCQA